MVAALSGVGLASVIACSGPGNTGRVAIGDDLAADVPWVKGRAPLLDEMGNVLLPELPIYPEIASGMEDPGSAPPDCSVLLGLKFSEEFWFDTFEADPTIFGGVGTAPRWSSYDDSSDGVFRVPGQLEWYPGLLGRHQTVWGMPAEQVEGAPSCNGQGNDWVFHFRGGRFNRFGGGITHPFAQECVLEDTSSELCRPDPADDDEEDVAGFPTRAKDGSPYSPPDPHEFWDVSRYDGISFWARRGPESQGSISIIVFDKYTSDDLNRENATYCRRLRDCRTECINREPCTPEDPNNEDSIHRCYDPDLGGPLTVGDPALRDEIYPRCGKSACTFRTDYPDPDFEGKECRPYTFQTHEHGEYCFDEDDPAPPEQDERCGDGYARSLVFTTDWEFYKVPFSEMRQQGHGKVSPAFDLTSVSGMAIVTAKGWVDIYLDNLSFYQEAK